MLNHLHGKPASDQPSGSMQGWARHYDLMVRLLSFGQEKQFRQATLDLADIHPGENILEVGCGTGTLTLAARQKAGTAGQIVGIDVASDMLEAARQKAARARLDVQFQPGRIEAIPFPDETFDLVLSSLMLHHVHGDAAKQDGMREIMRVLKPGGRVLIVDMAPPKNSHLRGLASLIVGHGMLAHGVAEYRSLLETAGFEGIATGPTRSSFLGYLKGNKPLA